MMRSTPLTHGPLYLFMHTRILNIDVTDVNFTKNDRIMRFNTTRTMFLEGFM